MTSQVLVTVLDAIFAIVWLANGAFCIDFPEKYDYRVMMPIASFLLALFYIERIIERFM